MSDQILERIASALETIAAGAAKVAANAGGAAGATRPAATAGTSKSATAAPDAAAKAAAAAATAAAAKAATAAATAAAKTASDKAAAAAKTATAKPGAGGPSGDTKAPGGKHTLAQVRDMIRKVATNSSLGKQSATDILDQDGGGVLRASDLKPENFDKVFEACQVLLSGEGDAAQKAASAPEDDLM